MAMVKISLLCQYINIFQHTWLRLLLLFLPSLYEVKVVVVVVVVVVVKVMGLKL